MGTLARAQYTESGGGIQSGNDQVVIATGDPGVYASPTGSGTACTFQNPCSLAQAKTNVRGEPSGKNTVFLTCPGGNNEYYLTAPLSFDSGDSGTSASPITYQPYPTGCPVQDGRATVLISGGKKITPGTWTVIGGGQTIDPLVNNTSACKANGDPTAGCYAAFTGLSTDAGNTNAQTQVPQPAPKHVSPNKISEYMYSGFAGDVWCEFQPWFSHGSFGHPDIGMDMANTAQIGAILTAMKNRGCTVVWVDWYDSAVDSGFDEATTQRIATALATGNYAPLKLGV